MDAYAMISKVALACAHSPVAAPSAPLLLRAAVARYKGLIYASATESCCCKCLSALRKRQACNISAACDTAAPMLSCILFSGTSGMMIFD